MIENVEKMRKLRIPTHLYLNDFQSYRELNLFRLHKLSRFAFDYYHNYDLLTHNDFVVTYH